MIPGMRTTTALQLIVVLLSLAVASINAEKGSCRAARRCCDGKDADCVVEINNPLLDAGPDYDEDDYEAVEPCYCDHGCLEVGDCCPDFKDYCGGIFFFICFSSTKQHFFLHSFNLFLPVENNYANESFEFSLCPA